MAGYQCPKCESKDTESVKAGLGEPSLKCNECGFKGWSGRFDKID